MTTISIKRYNCDRIEDPDWEGHETSLNASKSKFLLNPTEIVTLIECQSPPKHVRERNLWTKLHEMNILSHVHR